MIIGADAEAERVVELLVGEGYELISSTPAKVVGDLARSKPRLLIFQLDEHATRVDELMQRIQATAYGALVPVVFFGPAPGPSLAEVVMLGGDLFLPLPVDAEKLVASIRRLGGPPAPHPDDAAPTRVGRPSTGSQSVDAPAARRPTVSMAKAAGDLDGLDALGGPSARRPAKFPEPGDLDDLEDLSGLDRLAMPWDDIPLTRDSKSAEQPPYDEPDLMKQALAADLMLDPREMALSITTMVPEMRAAAEDLPSADEVTARPNSLARAAPLVTTPPSTGPDELSAVDAIVQEFMGTGGNGDTVAVRIRRTIDAFEEQIVAPQAEDIEHGLAPSSSRPMPRASGGLPKTLPDEIDLVDLDALDVDNSAGAYDVDPERVLQKLEDGLGTVAPRPRPQSDLLLTPGGTEVSHPDGLPPEPAPRDDLAEGDSADSFTPAQKNDYTEARKVPAPEEPGAHGTIADQRAPLASPYDLPPVVSAQGFEYVDPREERRDVVDTVPGRRTAVHYTAAEEHGGPTHQRLEEPGAGQNTQPAKGLVARGGRVHIATGDHAKVSASRPPRPGRLPTGSAAQAVGRPPPEVPARLREGTLLDMDPACLLQTIAQHELDGALVVTSPEARYELFFARGVPRLAQSSRAEDRMLGMLRRQGRITDRQLKECEAEVREGRRAGAVLLDRGWIKPSELIPTVRLHLEDLVYAIFALEEGTFRFDESARLPDEIVYLEQRPAALLLEGIRRKYTPGRIIRLAGSEEIIPVKTPDGDEGRLAGAELSGQDWRIIDAMDGRSSLAAVAEKLGAQPHDVWALAWGLSCLGLVKLQHPKQASVVNNRRTERLPEPPVSRPAEDYDFDLDVERVVSRHALVREGDYFACLGASPDASVHELRRAYDQARAQFEPEGLHPAVRTEFNAELQEILDVVEEAYSVLRDDTIREAYLRHVVRLTPPGEAP